MASVSKSDRALSLGLLLARAPMGAFLLLAGISKCQMGVSAFVSKASGAIPAWAPHDASRLYLHAVPFLEIIVGSLMVFGLFGRFAGLIGSLMLLSFTIAVTGIRDPQMPFQPNLIYLGLFLLIALSGAGGFSLDGIFFGSRSPRRTSAG